MRILIILFFLLITVTASMARTDYQVLRESDTHVRIVGTDTTVTESVLTIRNLRERLAEIERIKANVIIDHNATLVDLDLKIADIQFFIDEAIRLNVEERNSVVTP